MDPVSIVTIATTLFGAWQTWRAGKYKSAANVMVDAIEEAAVGNNPKHVVAIRTAGTVAGKVIDTLLDDKKLRKTKRAAAAHAKAVREFNSRKL